MSDEAWDDRETPSVRRREMLSLPVALACGSAVLTACGTIRQAGGAATSTPAPSTEQTQEVPVTPPEDLMREHGVLKRILLIYREGIRRINAGEPVPARPLHAGPASSAPSSRSTTSNLKNVTSSRAWSRPAN
ncbi:hypothetical protein ACFQE7_43795 [Nonomuraea ferruginea]|uniref:hypothetical protein n=1 Tax=Nonomuraea ferruginea TaxID=46174 RepID=UPI00360C3C44